MDDARDRIARLLLALAQTHADAVGPFRLRVVSAAGQAVAEWDADGFREDLRWLLERADAVDDAAVREATPGERDVIAERAKQRDRWGDAHDDSGHIRGDLALAAVRVVIGQRDGLWTPEWASRWDDRDWRTKLVKAAAMLIAEIDRFDRKAAP